MKGQRRERKFQAEGTLNKGTGVGGAEGFVETEFDLLKLKADRQKQGASGLTAGLCREVRVAVREDFTLSDT